MLGADVIEGQVHLVAVLIRSKVEARAIGQPGAIVVESITFVWSEVAHGLALRVDQEKIVVVIIALAIGEDVTAIGGEVHAIVIRSPLKMRLDCLEAMSIT